MKALLFFTGKKGGVNVESENTSAMAYSLMELGFAVDIRVVGLGNPREFAREFAAAIADYSVVITIGGMGDDFAKNAKDIICSGLNLNMAVHQPSVAKLERLCQHQNRPVEKKDYSYITVPEKSVVFEHLESVIPGFGVDGGSQVLVMLPDNGEVYVDLFSKDVVLYLMDGMGLRGRHEIILPFGLTDRQACQLMAPLLLNQRPMISLFCRGGVASTIQLLECQGEQEERINDNMDDALMLVEGHLGGLYADFPINQMPRRVIAALAEKGFTIAAAESITEGLLARNLKAVSGNENTFVGGCNTLINVVKQEEMGVPFGICDKYVDSTEEMAIAMAAGILRQKNADIGISICGGMAKDNRGGYDSSAYIALATRQGVHVDRIDLIGLSVSREQAIGMYTVCALNMVYRFVEGLPNSVRDLTAMGFFDTENIEICARFIRGRTQKKEEILTERMRHNAQNQAFFRREQRNMAEASVRSVPQATKEDRKALQASPPDEIRSSSFDSEQGKRTLGFRGIANPEVFQGGVKVEHPKTPPTTPQPIKPAKNPAATVVVESPYAEKAPKSLNPRLENPLAKKSSTPVEFNDLAVQPKAPGGGEKTPEMGRFSPKKGEKPLAEMDRTKTEKIKKPPTNVVTNHRPRKKRRRILPLVLLVVVVAVLVAGGFWLTKGLPGGTSTSAISVAEVLALYETGDRRDKPPADYPKEYGAQFIPLYQINKEIQAVVRVAGTDLYYPVVKAGDNMTYAEKDFFKKNTTGGTPYLDYRSSADGATGNPIIYGYNPGDNTGFGVIVRYQELGFAQSHPTIEYDTVFGQGEYLIFASFLVSVDKNSQDAYDFGKFIKAVDEDTFTAMVADSKRRSIVEFPVEVEYGDDVVVLTTTTADFEGARFAVVARKLRETESATPDMSQMKLSTAPLYPDRWYAIHGGIKPATAEVGDLVDRSIEQLLDQPEAVPNGPAETASAVSSPASSVPASSAPAPSSSAAPASSSAPPPASSAPLASSSAPPPSSIAPPLPSQEQEASSPPTTGGGSGKTLSVTMNGSTVTGDALDIVAQIVASEMGGSFPTEALKAQAVAAYSYVLYENNRGKSPSVPVRTPSAKVTAAVSAVIGQTITYQGKAAFATYYAISAGQTNSAADVWGTGMPYLVSVSSNWDTAVASYQVKKTFTEAEVRGLIESDMGFSPTGDPTTWFAITSYSSGGYNESMTVCGNTKTASGKKITGRFLREGVFGLRSAAFDVEYSGGNFVFTTRGYGHGVGMSQWGAAGMANEGYTYAQILSHYYPGTSLQ